MKMPLGLAFDLLIMFALCGCLIKIDQVSNVPPPRESVSATAIPENIATLSLQTTKVPITWANLNLSGRLVYINTDLSDSITSPGIHVLDLATGEATTIFHSPEGGWIFYAAITPDAKWLTISYAPPSQPGSLSNRALYIMPLDKTESPRLLITPPTPSDHYTQVEWSPDGKYIYYVHYNASDQPDRQLNPVYSIFRMTYPDGPPERIVDHAFWPRLTSDSSRLVYVALDPVSGRNELFLANADGRNSQRVTLSGSEIPEIIDAPIFSPDGQSILFSAPPPLQAYQFNWFERLMGIQVVKAHNIPSDWWSVRVTGGAPTRLTQIQTINLFASISPDHNHIASVSGEGLFVMNLDGSNLTQLIFDTGVYGTVRWIP